MENNEVIAEDIAAQIGFFYLDKVSNSSDKSSNTLDLSITKAYQQINELGITSVIYKDEIVVISLKRPGLIIGHHGKNIDKLFEFISKRLPNVKIKSWQIHEVKDVPGLFQFAYANGEN